jgi:hypothetical protein
MLRFVITLLALLAYSHADTTSWSWTEQASGFVKISMAGQTLWEGSPVYVSLAQSTSQWAFKANGATFLTYLFPPTTFSAPDTLIGDLSSLLSNVSTAFAPVNGSTYQQVDTRVWRLVSNDNPQISILANGANALTTAASSVVLCPASPPIHRLSFRCSSSSGDTILLFGISSLSWDGSSASLTFNVNITVPQTIAGISSISAFPQNIYDILALVAFRSRQIRELSTVIGSVAAANASRATAARTISIVFWVFLSLSTFAFVYISSFLQAWRKPIWNRFPIVFWTTALTGVAAAAILLGGVTGWAVLLFLGCIHILVICIMYCCRVDMCWPRFLRKCPGLCCIVISNGPTLGTANEVPGMLYVHSHLYVLFFSHWFFHTVASNDTMAASDFEEKKGFSLFAVKKVAGVDPVAASPSAYASIPDSASAPVTEAKSSWVIIPSKNSEKPAEAQIEELVQFEPACPERMSPLQEKICGASVTSFFVLVIVLIAFTLLVPLPQYSVR